MAKPGTRSSGKSKLRSVRCVSSGMGRGALSSVAKLQASFYRDFEELHWNTCWNSGQPNIFADTTFACYPESSLDAEGSHKCHAVGCLSGFVSKD